MNPTITLVILLMVSILMPLAFTWRVWRLDEPTLAGWLIDVADCTVFVLLILLVARWDIAGAYTRLVLAGLFLLAVLLSWRRHARRPWRTAAGRALWRSHWWALLSLAVFGAALVHVVAGLLPVQGARPLALPLEGGRFMVGQGGESPLLNHHYGHRAQRHAADITAIDRAGFRARSLLPADPARYAIYGAAVLSPCDGTVRETRDDLPDLAPPRADPQHPAGNHVVIACGGMLVELAHLQQGSVAVAAGDEVVTGGRIGRVGNSGNTTEPHLHVHAVDAATGEGVPIAFDGAAPVRNRIFSRPAAASSG